MRNYIPTKMRNATLGEEESTLQLAAMCIMYDPRPGRHEFEDVCGVTLNPGKTLRDAYAVRSRVLAQIGGDAHNEVVILGHFLREVFRVLPVRVEQS
jgi:hypothetical protein